MISDSWRVIDCRVDELAANLNAQTEARAIVSQDYYSQDGVRRVTVLLVRMQAQPMALPPGFDPRKIRQN